VLLLLLLPLLLLLLLLVQVAKDLGDSVQILKLDVDKNPSMSTRLQVGGAPALAGLRQAVGSCTCAPAGTAADGAALNPMELQLSQRTIAPTRVVRLTVG
jgi:hypothetical protein